MPELPEVETVANGVHERVRGARVDRVTIGPHKEPLKSPAAHIEDTLTGARIERVRRVGKTIVVDVKKHDGQLAQMTVHLGMTGRLLVSRADVPVPPHTHATLHLHDGREVRFVDPRRFGRVGIVDEGTQYEGPGAEPLTITTQDFAALFKGRKTPIKSALLDQRVVAGLGNIYVCEALFHSGISPLRLAKTIGKAKIERLVVAIRQVLNDALASGGSSLRNFLHHDGELGYFQHHFAVYDREGKPCPGCDCDVAKTGGVSRIVQAGRSTFYCPRRQR